MQSSETQAQRFWLKLSAVFTTRKSLPWHNSSFHLSLLYPYFGQSGTIHPGKLFPSIWFCPLISICLAIPCFFDCFPYLSATFIEEIPPSKVYFSFTFSVIWDFSLLWIPLYFPNVVEYFLSFLMYEHVSLFYNLRPHCIYICIIHDT